MPKYFLHVALALVLLLGACASEQRLEDLEDTLNLYKTKLRWSSFDEVVRFRKEARTLALEDYQRLGNIRITSYQEKQRILTDDMLEVEQVVIIGFYDKESGKEHQVLDKQIWKYDEDNQSWFLESDLPKFIP